MADDEALPGQGNSPEVLVINALLEQGEFTPGRYGVNADMLVGYQQAWSFCQQHQDAVGTAPSRELFFSSFPSIESIANVDPQWAADRLKEAHHERELRRRLGDATRAMREGDLDAVRAAAREIALPGPSTTRRGLSITDIETVAQQGVKIGFTTPWPSLNAVTHGYARGEFGLLGARLGQGKSWMLPGLCIGAAKMGANVAVVSCEMTMKRYAHRLHVWQADRDAKLLRLLRSPHEDERRSGLTQLPPLVGSIDVFDPSVARSTMSTVESLAADYDVVAIDHVGLLMDSAGKRAIEDWRIMAAISNSLKEVALAFNVAIPAAVQINREGEAASSAPPKVSQLAQSDALGQDADWVITYRRLGERSMLHSLGKNREGRSARWYTKFEPEGGDFTEITSDEARVRMMIDNDNSYLEV